jgi:hypothetical protein
LIYKGLFYFFGAAEQSFHGVSSADAAMRLSLNCQKAADKSA